MLQRIRMARERIRDVAATEVARAEAERRRREDLRTQTDRARSEILREAERRLNDAAGIADIEKIGMELCDADRILLEAEEALNEAMRVRDDAADTLREKERDVRRSEMLVVETRKEMNRELDKLEQATVDDIVSSRWRRRT